MSQLISIAFLSQKMTLDFDYQHVERLEIHSSEKDVNKSDHFKYHSVMH